MNKKIHTLNNLVLIRQMLKEEGKRVVFTNGCFDILHSGHIHLFREAKILGEVLMVGVNSDESIRKIKDSTRPIFCLEERLEILEAIADIDYLVPFAEETPQKVISALLPDILVKGGDWPSREIVGRREVEKAGGEVVIIPYLPSHSTSEIIERIIAAVREQAADKNGNP